MASFENRSDAGRQLCQLLTKYKGENVVVYAIPRGGITIAEPIAKYLNAPIDLLLSHKIGHPYQPEYAIAAISSSGYMVGNSDELLLVDKQWLHREQEKQLQEIQRKKEKYLKGKREIPLKDKIAIIVDDGIATGLTIQAGIKELKSRHPKKIVIAVPVAPKSIADFLKVQVDDFIAIDIPDDYSFLGSVGSYYDEFDQVEDDEVIFILDKYQKSFEKAKKQEKSD